MQSLYNMGLNTRKPVFGVSEQQRRRPACWSAQSDQRLCYSLIGKYHILTFYKQIFNFLASLCSCRDWFESRFVGNPEYRFSRDESHISASSWDLYSFEVNIRLCQLEGWQILMFIEKECTNCFVIWHCSSFPNVKSFHINLLKLDVHSAEIKIISTIAIKFLKLF